MSEISEDRTAGACSIQASDACPIAWYKTLWQLFPTAHDEPGSKETTPCVQHSGTQGNHCTSSHHTHWQPWQQTSTTAGRTGKCIMSPSSSQCRPTRPSGPTPAWQVTHDALRPTPPQVQLLLRKVRPEWGPDTFTTVTLTTHGDRETEGELRKLGQGAFTGDGLPCSFELWQCCCSQVAGPCVDHCCPDISEAFCILVHMVAALLVIIYVCRD